VPKNSAALLLRVRMIALTMFSDSSGVNPTCAAMRLARDARSSEALTHTNKVRSENKTITYRYETLV